MAARTNVSPGSVRLRSLALFVLVFSVCALSVSSHGRSFQSNQHDVVEVSYFSSSQNNFGVRGKLSEPDLRQQEFDILQLSNDNSIKPLSSNDVSEYWNSINNGRHLDVPHFRRRRAVTSVPATEEVPETKTGVLIDFPIKLNLVGRRYTLNSTSVYPEMFQLSPAGQLRLNDGFSLDYEDPDMRTVEFVIDATSASDSSDVYRITATLTVTDVDEPPVFVTEPQPYRATVRTNTGPGYTIITLVARDPEGASIHYEKTLVSPSTYNNRIEVRSETVNGIQQCQLLTTGSGSLPQDQTISISVSARDSVNGGQQTTVTVSVRVGVLPPQFFENNYEGSMPEQNQPQQTVYKLRGSEELTVEWKTFQQGVVSLSLTNEGGGSSQYFEVKRGTGNRAYILCSTTLDFETANPKTQNLTLTAVQRVGSANLQASVPVSVKIEDTNDNRPIFQQSQYQEHVMENLLVGSTVLRVTAEDADTGVNAQIVYSLLNTEDFEIVTHLNTSVTPSAYEGIIRVKRPLDYERTEGPYYSFQVQATDQGTPAQSSTSNVRVTVINVNDEIPQFNMVQYEYSVLETASVGDYIMQVYATDKDGDRITYSFTSGSQIDQKFRISRETGELTLNAGITDNDDRFTLNIRATDDGSCCTATGGQTQNSNDTTIYIQITGINSARPDFTQCLTYNPSVDEHSPIGTSVLQVHAVDDDRGPNGVVTYILSSPQSETSNFFTIDSSSGEITVAADIDREAITKEPQLVVRGKDQGIPSLEGFCSFRVTVNDINDNTPRFEKLSYVANITRDLAVGVSFVVVKAFDDDVGNNARITYSLPHDGEGKFSIIPENGFISLTKELEQADIGRHFNLTVMAKDGGNPPLNSTASVMVTVKAGTSTPPRWDKDYSNMNYTVAETADVRQPVIANMICSSEIDNPRVGFQLINHDGAPVSTTEFFDIVVNGNTVSVYPTSRLDYKEAPKHTVRIRCLNFGTSLSMMSEVTPTVYLIDTNNQVPEFVGTNTGEVQENKPAGTSVMTIEAIDADTVFPDNDVTFSITSGEENFAISPGSKMNTAIITTRRPFDTETASVLYVWVKATDGSPSTRPGYEGAPNSDVAYITIKIKDVNDNAPFFPQTEYNISVPESYYLDQLIPPPIAVEDDDQSDQGRHTYRILSGNEPLTFGVRDGLGSLFLVRKLDYEAGEKNFVLVLEAKDGKFNATTTVYVTVLDENDNSPIFTPGTYFITDIVENDQNVPKLLMRMNATDADVDRPNQIRYSLEGSSFNVSQFFSIDKVTGDLYLNRPLDRDPPEGRPSYQFTVTAADEQTDPNFGYATVFVNPIDINDNKPKFITSPLEATVPEHSDKGTSVVLISARDNDYGINGTVLFTITDIKDKAGVARPNYFAIGLDTGLVTTNTSKDNLDRETMDTYLVTILLTDMAEDPLQDSGVLTIKLSDINDQPPICQQSIYSTEMSENLKSGEVIRVIATDADIGINAKVFYVLSGENTHFSVKDVDNEGSVQIETPVDYEQQDERFFNLTVKAQDSAGHEDTCYVEISVLDFNDNAPVIHPSILIKNVSEAAPPNTLIAVFNATDADITEINNAFEFSISRSSDRRRHFSINPKTGEVKIRRKLDRETQAIHELVIQAIDKGSPPQTGTAILTVIVEDVNDNYPTFKEDYHPHVLETKDLATATETQLFKEVQKILAKDPDADPYANPFGFLMTNCGKDCDKFQFSISPNDADGNGSAIISTKYLFNREQQKYYYLPIIMWDMRGTGSSLAMTGTNTLTVTIADINDNPMFPGTQNMLVYNYKGSFGPVQIGRVYVEDLDDWDLPSKIFTSLAPDWMKKYFTVDVDTGMVTMQKGVPSTLDNEHYEFQVRVYDDLFENTVTSKVRTQVKELTEEAVRNSGATRFKGTSAEAFIKPNPSSPDGRPQSKFGVFLELLAAKLNTDPKNVQIISVLDVEGGYTDVRYAVHGSPYYPPSQTDSIVALNKEEFQRKVNAEIAEVPIDACAEEVFEGGCYNFMNITGNPAMVNSNGSSFVGVEVFIQAREGCRALDFPEPNQCSGDYCYHGGTCVQDKFGVLSCQNCPPGFDGPRCQQLSHSFDGKSFAMYSTLEQCEDSETSIEFITLQANGMLLYNGPLTNPTGEQPQDFIALELYGGMPVLSIDHGSGHTSLSLDGQDSNNNAVLSSLADGKWHKIDIVRKGKHVEMIVDDCKAAGPSGSEGTAPDTKPCRVSGATPGENSFMNVATLLQLGGRSPNHSYPSSNLVRSTGFNGCVRNLMHNGKYYDLHYKETPSVPSGDNGCPREDQICNRTCNQNGCTSKCGVNGICSADFSPAKFTCLCKPGWRGSKCSTETTVRDLESDSFFQWQLKTGVTLPSYELEVQVMYRTWNQNGVLFTVSMPETTQRVTMELKDSRLQVQYNLDSKDNTLVLDKAEASDGQWHTARFKRVMHQAILTLDAGEGRNYAMQREEGSSVYMTVNTSSPMYCGAIVTNPSGAQVLDRDLTDTCIQDVRLNNQWLPMKSSENAASTVANFVKAPNVKDGCSRPDGCINNPTCPPNMVCVPLWGQYECRCAPGYYENGPLVCESDCVPNPCFQNETCHVDTGEAVCNCTLPWTGRLCNIYVTEDDEPSVAMTTGAIIAIVVSILVVILLVLLAFLLATYYMRKKSRDDFDKFVVEEDADFDIRENVMFYDEEGAGEEDQDGFDLTKLPLPASETIRPPTEMPLRRTEMPRARRAPDDRPDVGDVLHDRLGDADDDPDAPPYDTFISFADEGAGSDAGSLSSLGSSSSDASQDYDYLNDWGPKFAKLADMYGAGQE